MFDEQLSSFLSKFHQLRRAGATAHLDIDTYAGKAWVGLRVMLGSVQHHQHHPNVPNANGRRRSPSYYRRQEKRKAARAAEKPSSSDVTEVTEEVNKSDNVNGDDVVTTAEARPTDHKVDEKKNAEEASSTPDEFNCELCDFISNRKNGLNIHMSRKHPRIEQIDGNMTVTEANDKDYDISEEFWRSGLMPSTYNECYPAVKAVNRILEANSDTLENIKDEEKLLNKGWSIAYLRN